SDLQSQMAGGVPHAVDLLWSAARRIAAHARYADLARSADHFDPAVPLLRFCLPDAVVPVPADPHQVERGLANGIEAECRIDHCGNGDLCPGGARRRVGARQESATTSAITRTGGGRAPAVFIVGGGALHDVRGEAIARGGIAGSRRGIAGVESA